jgi:hypothetical protein
MSSTVFAHAASAVDPPLVDWEAIEREYRAGQVSVREIARKSAVTEGSIRKRDGWTRNLADQVREAGGDDAHGGSQPLRDAEIMADAFLEPNAPQPSAAPAAADEAPPAGGDVFVTYLAGDGDPPTTTWRGVEFSANIPVRITDPEHLEAIKGNPFFRVGVH